MRNAFRLLPGLVLAILVSASVAAAGENPALQAARKAFEAEKYGQVDVKLEKLLQQHAPPAEALRLSYRAALAEGRLITAGRRLEALLRGAEKRDLDLMVEAAELAGRLGDHGTELERYRYFVLQSKKKDERLAVACANLLERGIYPRVFRVYIERYGADGPAWHYGRQLLERLIRAHDGDQVLETAGVLLEAFPAPERRAAVSHRLREAADNYLFGRDEERYGRPLQLLIKHGLGDTGVLRHLYERAGAGPGVLLEIQQAHGAPLPESLFRHFHDLRNIQEEPSRLAFARRYLEFEPLYRKAEDPEEYLRYVWVIAESPNVFQIKGKELLGPDRAAGMFSTLTERFQETPGRLHELSWRLLDRYLTDAKARAELVAAHPAAVRPDRLRLALDEGTATLAAIRKATGDDLDVRYVLLPYFTREKDKAGLLRTAREQMLAHPGTFGAGHLGPHFMRSGLATLEEKLAVLKEVYAKAGPSGAMDRLLQEAEKDKAIQESEAWKAFRAAYAKKKPGSDALLTAHVTLHEMKQQAHRPKDKVHEVAAAGLKAYAGRWPTGQDPLRDAALGDLLQRYQGHVWHNREHVYRWGRTVAPHLGRTGYWHTVIRRVREHRGDNELQPLARAYVKVVEAGWEGDPGAWAELRHLYNPKQSDTSILAGQYGRMRPWHVWEYIAHNRSQWSHQTFVDEVDRMLKAHPAAAHRPDDLRRALHEVWSRVHPGAKPEPATVPPSLAKVFWQEMVVRDRGGGGERERAVRLRFLLGEKKQALTEYLAALQALPPYEQINRLSEFAGTVMHDLPREENGAEPKPLHRAHILRAVLKPALEALSPTAHPRVWVRDHLLRELAHWRQHGSEAMQADALAMTQRLGAVLFDQASFHGHAHDLFRAVDPILRRAVEGGDWTTATEAAVYLARAFGRDNNWGHMESHHIRPLTALLREAGAWEVLYLFTTETLRREPPEALEGQLASTKAEAARHVGDLYPVNPKDPTFDLYRAADELVVGNRVKAWDLTLPKRKLLTRHWRKLDKDYVAWCVEQLRQQKMLEEAKELALTVLLHEDELPAEAAARVLLSKADVYRDLKNYEAARMEYEGLKNHRRYAHTVAGEQARFRLMELLIAMGLYDTAEMMLDSWLTHTRLEMRAEAHYYLALMAFKRGDLGSTKDQLDEVFNLAPGHTEARLLQGRWKVSSGHDLDDPDIPIGRKGERASITPGRQLTVSLTDRNLAVVRGGQAVPVVVSTSEGNDRERVNLYATSSNPHEFKAVVATGLGEAVPGNLSLELLGSDVVRYEIDPAFREENNLPEYPAKELRVVDRARLAASAGRILSEEEAEQRALLERLAFRSASTRYHERTGSTVRPGNKIYLQVRDYDRNLTDQPDEVRIRIQTSSGDVIDGFPLVETAPHSGVFRGEVPTGMPPPRAEASDTAEGRDVSVLINSTRDGEWMSRAGGEGPKWIEVDTMSSHAVAATELRMPEPGSVKGLALYGMLTGDMERLGSFPARETQAEGGVLVEHVPNRHREHTVDRMRWIVRRAGLEPVRHAEPVFDRDRSPKKGDNGWMISRVRGAFYVPENTALDLKFMHKPSPRNWQYAYLLIDNEQVLGGRLNRGSIEETRTVRLPEGAHTFELLVRDHWKHSRVEVGVRQDDGTFAPLPAAWFSTTENPELAEFLSEKATLERGEKGFVATLEAPRRLRRLRWVFEDFSGNAVRATKLFVTTENGEALIPVETDFTAATANETLEIAPGDSIEVSYVDEVRPAEQAPVHVAELNSSFYNGAVRIANEVVVERRGEMVSELDDASRFRQGDQLMVVVEEYDLDVSDAADEVQVSVRTSSGEETTIRAREIHQHQHARESDPYHSGVFHGVLKTGKQTEGDRIKVQPGDRITVAYMDRENTDPGIPIERTASVMEAGRGRPRLVVYRTGTEMVPDRSLEAKSRLRLLRLRGREVDEATILKRRVRALHPRAEAAAAHSSGGELRVSMQAPLLLQMVHPSRALNRGSVIEAEVVTERELRAAEEEGREPETVPVPMAIAPLGEHARRYGYHDLRIVSPIRRTEGELMRDGVFSGVVRLQIGSPGDPVNDLVLEASPEGIYGTNQRGGDLLLEEESEPLRVPTILVSGPETLYVRYRDPDLDDLVQEKVRLVSAGRLEILDDTYTVSKNAIHMGESFYLQVSDPDRDRSDEQDRITVAIRAAESGDRYGLTLTETMPHSGVFTGSVQPKLSEKARLARLAAARGQGGAEDAADKSGKEPGKADDPPTPATDGAEAAAAAGTDRPAAAAAQEDPEDGVFRVAFGDTVTFVYEDDMTLTGEAGVVEARGRVHHGADGTLVAFSKRFKDPEMAVKVRFLRAEAKLEMAKEYRKLKQEARSSELIAEGKRILTEALRDYPDTSLVAQGEYLLANLAQELGRDEEDDALRRQYYQEAIGKYSKIISTWPESDYAARSQFKMALCLEKMGDFDRASEEYVKLTYTYPAHELVTDATVRLGNYYYQAKQFKVAGKIFFNFQQRYPTHELAPRALFLGAQCHMKQAAEVAGDERLRSARNEQFQEALKALELLLTTYQDEKELRAESMYWMGDIHFKTGDYRASYIAFKKLTFDYPSTEWAKRARGYLTDEKFARIEE